MASTLQTNSTDSFSNKAKMLSKNNTNTVLSGLIKSSERQKEIDSNPDNGKNKFFFL